MYTDGLIERRGQNIDEGIDLLGRVIATGVDTSPERIVRNVSEAIGAPDDDVALLLATMEALIDFQVEVPADPSTLPELRRRLRGVARASRAAVPRSRPMSCSQSAKRATTRSNTPIATATAR